MRTRRLCTLILSVSLVLLAACGAPATSIQSPAGHAPTGAAAAAQTRDKLPLYFVANQGQTDASVDFYVPGKDNTIYFTPDGLTFALTSPSAATPELRGPTAGGKRPDPSPQNPAPQTGQRWSVKLDFVGANTGARPLGEDPTAAVFSYFKGQPSQWHTAVPSYAQVRYPNLWSGIDLVYSGLGNQMKYEFEVQPGADPAQIRLAYRGASGVQLTADGQLQVTTPVGAFQDAAPVGYQMKDGQRVPVAMSYQLDAHAGAAGSVSYSFHLGAYDASLPLVLDPAVIVYAGYIGGAGADYGYGIAVDKDGNAYVTGGTDSDQTTFPVTVGPDPTYNGSSDTFVAKVNAAGTALVYAGYIGGSGYDFGTAIVVDSAGNAYVAGYTTSNQTTFPVKGGPGLTYGGGFTDAFVAKVNAAGTALVYAGYIGGSGYDYNYGIAVDKDGNAYVAGYTTSDQTTFPVKMGPGLTYGGAGDAFVAKVTAAGTALVYAGYIGGSGNDGGSGIAVDKDGNAYVAGFTMSDQTTFPATVGPGLTYSGGFDDAFVAKVNAAGTVLDYAGYIGGSGYDYANGIAVDSAGNAYVAGYTQSDQTTFPVKVGPGLTYSGVTDAFVAKVNAAGTALVYAGYIGGASDDRANGIAVDTDGNAYVTGKTASTEATFPVRGGPGLTEQGGYDTFVAKVNATGASLVYAGFIGGSAADFGQGIAVDSAGNAYVTGYTASTQATFPVKVGPGLTYNGGMYDAFVAKVSDTATFLYLPLVQR